jgi:hypothetical protein
VCVKNIAQIRDFQLLAQLNPPSLNYKGAQVDEEEPGEHMPKPAQPDALKVH